MNKQTDIRVIREQFDAPAALQRVAAVAGEAGGRVEQKILYPYFHFTARCSVPTLLGRRALRVDCLVDGINGNGATADPFNCDTIASSNFSRLPGGIGHDTAARCAQRTVTHRLARKFRTIARFDVEIEPAGTIYRGFWIVRIGNGRIMLDSVTGAIQSLCAAA